MLEKPLGPVQLTIEPLVVAERLSLLAVQVSVPPLALTVGGVVSPLIVTVNVIVHPVASETVTVCSPSVRPVAVAEV